MKADVIQIRELRQARVRRALDELKFANDNWKEKSLALAEELKATRDECGGNDIAFGHWLIDNGCDDLGRNERAVLIRIAENIEIAKEVFAHTVRKSLRAIWQLEIKPLIIHTSVKEAYTTSKPEPAPGDAPIVNLPVPYRTRNNRHKINIPEGTVPSDLARKGIALQQAGVSVVAVPRQIGLSLQTYVAIRDTLLLSERDDLSEADSALIKQTLAAIDETRFLKIDDKIKEIGLRVWGPRGNRLKSDKNRSKRFNEAVNFIHNTCESAADIDIPIMTAENASRAVAELSAAMSSLRRLQSRIREGTQ
jgi:hypothetical protein